MLKSKHYQKCINSYVQEIKQTNDAAVVFGADRGGWIIMKVLEHFGVPIVAFIDNDENKLGIFHDHPGFSSSRNCS